MKSKSFAVHGHEYITSKINEAIENGSRTAIVSGCFEIGQAIRLPSHFTLILQRIAIR